MQSVYLLSVLCSAGSRIPWLTISRQELVMAVNSSETINLTYHSDGLAAGTYRAQLCLFADYSYGKKRKEMQGSTCGIV